MGGADVCMPINAMALCTETMYSTTSHNFTPSAGLQCCYWPADGVKLCEVLERQHPVVAGKSACVLPVIGFSQNGGYTQNPDCTGNFTKWNYSELNIQHHAKSIVTLACKDVKSFQSIPKHAEQHFKTHRNVAEILPHASRSCQV